MTQKKMFDRLENILLDIGFCKEFQKYDYKACTFVTFSKLVKNDMIATIVSSEDWAFMNEQERLTVFYQDMRYRAEQRELYCTKEQTLRREMKEILKTLPEKEVKAFLNKRKTRFQKEALKTKEEGYPSIAVHALYQIESTVLAQAALKTDCKTIAK